MKPQRFPAGSNMQYFTASPAPAPMNKRPDRTERLLIMTATITPPTDAPGLVRVDPGLRLADYRSALEWYLQFIGAGLDRIIFAENSLSDTDSLRDTVAQAGHAADVEFFSFDGMGKPATYGRCYGESVILDRVMQGSRFATDAGAKAEFWKITGRYKVLNLRSMLRTRPRHAAFYCDLRDRGTPWADMRLMSWSRDGYQTMLQGVGELIREDSNGGRPGEESLHRVLTSRLENLPSRVVTSFRREPLIDGVRAFDNQNWSQGRQRLVFLARDTQRRILRRVYF
jgi:hypothetical protein